MTTTRAFAAQSPTTPLGAHSIERREPGPHDVKIDILFCGVCHSDLHTARGEWEGTKYPCVPGHEIVGKVVAVGAHVTKFAAGDRVGVGCMVDSCRECESCKAGNEQYCYAGNVGTYNGKDTHLGGHTLGGYSASITVDEDFVLRIPDGLPLDATAPLLCAGITLYSPLMHWHAGSGKRVGIVGLGGLGHMGVKIARALGAHVTMITTSPGKAKDAAKLGAHDVIISTDTAQMKAAEKTFDLLMNTVSATHDFNAISRLLKVDGAHVLLGVPPTDFPPPVVGRMIGNRLTLAGSTIGGIRETQEMLEFCARHDIVSDIEMIRMDQINEAYERMLRGDVKYRFVIDMATLKAA
ncbi:MAG: NAD(P)-dependent alcohol dehydrogenase [Devosia nanyangense]|uniref:NAD(P)-dependent alcohol dehydrogenase n=1 Tax=Devosia nanyangense TaxID=1228055 RepID=A0A933L304_9HYPH|nr:NAD(P)-dependent alcohol dehydrogenase [Devosia nanyangense]